MQAPSWTCAGESPRASGIGSWSWRAQHYPPHPQDERRVFATSFRVLDRDWTHPESNPAVEQVFGRTEVWERRRMLTRKTQQACHAWFFTDEPHVKWWGLYALPAELRSEFEAIALSVVRGEAFVESQ